jgi:hypothetical protein
MEIRIDLLPRKDGFFISAGSGREVISFDHTSKGHRILKQRFAGYTKCKEKQSMEKPDKTWQTLRLVDGVPKELIEEKWFDRGESDIVNGEMWDTVWEKPLPAPVRGRLSGMSLEIYRNRKDLRRIKPLLKEFDKYVSELVERYKGVPLR